jgi:D-alanyl-D-alanine carboxypeptidase/D-alanyl-D-alanine-endopeptidase (penicillin-binding protein 4)
LSFTLQLQGNQRVIEKRDPIARYFRIQNNLQFVNQYNPKVCKFSTKFLPNHTLALNGCLPNHQSWPLTLAVQAPQEFIISFIQTYFAQHNIRLQGAITFGPTPNGIHVIATHSSPPLYLLLRVMLANSNNLYADTMSRMVGRVATGAGTPLSGAQATIALIRKLTHQPFSQLKMMDGSGCSYDNRTTPLELAHLLAYIRETPLTREYLIPGLALNGQTGTLAYRLGKRGFIGRIRGKTGTLSTVSAVSGYMITFKNHALIFSILNNQPDLNPFQAHGLQDQLMEWLIRHA